MSERPCPWCGCVGYHMETCDGFVVNDPGMEIFTNDPYLNGRKDGYRAGWDAAMKTRERELHRLQYELDDARRKEQRAHDRLQCMKEAMYRGPLST